MVLFRSAAEILDEFDLPKDGPHYRRLVEGFQRIFTSTIYFGTDAAGGRQEVWDCRRFHFFDRLRIWCSSGSGEDGLGDATVISRTFARRSPGPRGKKSSLPLRAKTRHRNWKPGRRSSACRHGSSWPSLLQPVSSSCFSSAATWPKGSKTATAKPETARHR